MVKTEIQQRPHEINVNAITASSGLLKSIKLIIKSRPDLLNPGDTIGQHAGRDFSRDLAVYYDLIDRIAVGEEPSMDEIFSDKKRKIPY